ncbi:MAG: M28 family peptidase [Anaeromyxobacteraceae bacterium]
MRRTPAGSALLLAALLVAPGAPRAAAPPGAADRAAAGIDEAALRAHVRFLASDLLEGRAPATRGDALAEAYVAAQLEALGFAPAAPEGGMIQKVPLVVLRPEIPAAMTFTRRAERLELRHQEDFVAAPGVRRERAAVEEAEVVFVGYGITAPEYAWDDFKGVDVRGKVLLVMNNDPEDDPKLFAGRTRLWYGRWPYKYEEAARRGAAGAIIIHTEHSAAYPWSVVQSSWAGEQVKLPEADSRPEPPLEAWATEAASRRLAALGGKDLDALRAAAERRDFTPVPLGVHLSFAMRSAMEEKVTGNVLARLPGREARLAGEAVVYTAHHDHLGVRPGARPGDDAIYNGAVDNASGVAGILAIARAFAALPPEARPRRSIVVAIVAAEESGLLGSEWLVRHPPLPPARMAANLNFDSMNIFGRTRDLCVLGLGKSTLDPLVARLARAQGRRLAPDPFPDRGSFYRSDQLNFARGGVPAIQASGGVDFVGRPPGWGAEQVTAWIRTHYHQPSDEYREDWDLRGAVEDVRLNFLLGLAVADADAMPAWRPGDEFEAARKASQASR